MKGHGRAAIMQWGRDHWVAIRRIGTGIFILVVLSLIVIAAANVNWPDVLTAIRKLPASSLWTAAALVAAGYVACSGFDVLGKWYTGHNLAVWRSMAVGFISYSFTMNMGSPVGGALRLRLYLKQGLGTGIAMRVLAFSLTTNWMGYLLLAGAVFASGKVRMPASWDVGSDALRFIGVGMVAANLAYLFLCAVSKKRSWVIRGHKIELPRLRTALLQIVLAMASWSLIGAVIYVLLQQNIPYLLVLGVLLLSAIAGAVAHIPGGLGVTESVFIAMLSGAMPRPEILGALLVYRALYYLAPLLLASLLYLGAEAGLRKAAKSAPS